MTVSADIFRSLTRYGPAERSTVARPMRSQHMAESKEFYTVVDGKKVDAPMHEDMLDNPGADRELSELAVKRAIAGGMDPKEARELYGLKS